MTPTQEPLRPARKITRRDLLFCTLAGTGLAGAAVGVQNYLRRRESAAAVFIARADSYQADLTALILDGFRHLAVSPAEIRGRRILLKPNLIETAAGTVHICTQPPIIAAAAEAFLRLGAARVVVAEGSGNARDTLRIVEETGLGEILRAQKLAFVDLNNDDLVIRKNAGRFTGLRELTLPALLEQVDWIVSMPKMKTHHWAGVTVSMKNLFGLMPGIVYGWPKNVLHVAGIHQSILDIVATVRPHFAIVDGIIGMEGDGPLAGTPKPAGVVVMGKDTAAVDATSARIMGVDPFKVPYLNVARGWLGTVTAARIAQRGEAIHAVRTDFQLLDHIAAQKGLRLAQDAL
jgi:uncharacterized protein (DUF362 family)